MIQAPLFTLGFVFFLAAVLGTQVKPMSHRHYQGLYIILSALMVMVNYLTNAYPMGVVVGGILLGEVVHFLAIAFLGDRLSTRDGQLILALGLFPWVLGPVVVIAGIVGAVAGQFAALQFHASKAAPLYGLSGGPLWRIRGDLGERWGEFRGDLRLGHGWAGLVGGLTALLASLF